MTGVADIGGFCLSTPVVLGSNIPAFLQVPRTFIDTKRREPWLYSAGEMSLIRTAVKSRNALLPLW